MNRRRKNKHRRWIRLLNPRMQVQSSLVSIQTFTIILHCVHYLAYWDRNRQPSKRSCKSFGSDHQPSERAIYCAPRYIVQLSCCHLGGGLFMFNSCTISSSILLYDSILADLPVNCYSLSEQHFHGVYSISASPVAAASIAVLASPIGAIIIDTNQ